MKRLGFWGRKDGEPTVPELLIKKEADLQKELNALWEQQRKYQNKEAVLREMRIKRMAEAKAKREETKKKKEQERFEKAAAWKQKKQNEIIYLGEDVSIGLNNNESTAEKLNQNKLPHFVDESALAQAIGIELKELRFLAFNRKVSTINHYRKFFMPKKSGGKRLISAPMPRLKKAQHWILLNILEKVPVHQAANGFLANRSIVTNARQHVAKALVLNMDVKDFFPSIHFKRVKGVLQQLGYSEKIASILALICTEAVTEEIEIDGKRYFVQMGKRVLPQGAPTSPAITNILCFSLDKRLKGLADKVQCNYTRYADDITFSAEKETNAQQLVWRIKRILQDEGFTVHPDKIRIMRKGTQQEVTGVIVNQQLNVNRKDLREFRALLHTIRKSKDFEKFPENVSNSILGYVNFIKMVNPAKAVKFQNAIDKLYMDNILQKNPPTASKKLTKDSSVPPPVKPDDNKDDKSWWDVV